MDDEPPRILIADDDRLVLATLVEGLRKAGFLVEEAVEGRQALARGIETIPDLAILDFRMPGLLGTEVARQLREQAHVPSLFLSAYDDEDAVNQALDQGALGYLVKPVAINQLVPAVRVALKKSREIADLRIAQQDLEGALERGRDINAALGLIMSTLSVERVDAFEALRGYARSTRSRVYELAREVMEAQDTVNRFMDAIRGALKEVNRDKRNQSRR